MFHNSFAPSPQEVYMQMVDNTSDEYMIEYETTSYIQSTSEAYDTPVPDIAYIVGAFRTIDGKYKAVVDDLEHEQLVIDMPYDTENMKVVHRDIVKRLRFKPEEFWTDYGF